MYQLIYHILMIQKNVAPSLSRVGRS